MSIARVHAVSAVIPDTADPAWRTICAALPDGDHRAAATRPAGPLRDRFHAGRLLARRLLDRHGADAAAPIVQVAPGTKPRVVAPAGSPPVSLSISHCADRVLCAISFDGDVGADVERADAAGIDACAIADTYFAATEARLLHHAPAAMRTPLFLRIWTLKEAVAKATGHGLAMPLAGFALHPDSRTVILPDGAQRFALHGFVDGGHVLALALRHGGETMWRHRPVSLAQVAGELTSSS